MKACFQTALAALSTAVALALPATALAHVDISPTEVEAGKPTVFSLSVGHACDGVATIGLDVKLPPEAGEYKARSIAGWKATTGRGQMSWSGGPEPEGTEFSLPFRATVFGSRGDQVPFKIIQRCEGGVETAWIQTGSNESELETPAPVLTLTSTVMKSRQPAASTPERAATEPEASPAGIEANQSGDDSGGIGIGPIVGLILIAASVTAFVVIRRGRRSAD